jgi:RNA polymerase sigma-70 factor (ECF subfamily)
LQRTVLVLREVFGWRAAEVAELLGVSVASVNSARQRANATLGATGHCSRGPSAAADDVQRHDLLTRCVDAFERYEIEVLASLLRDDAPASARRRTRPPGRQMADRSPREPAAPPSHEAA